MADASLSAMLGTDCARLVHSALPRIEKQMSLGAKRAVVDVRFTFQAKNGEVVVQVTSLEKVQAPTQERKLLADSQGQLTLFEVNE